jgi:hypothetical protein
MVRSAPTYSYMMFPLFNFILYVLYKLSSNPHNVTFHWFFNSPDYYVSSNPHNITFICSSTLRDCKVISNPHTLTFNWFFNTTRNQKVSYIPHNLNIHWFFNCTPDYCTNSALTQYLFSSTPHCDCKIQISLNINVITCFYMQEFINLPSVGTEGFRVEYTVRDPGKLIFFT